MAHDPHTLLGVSWGFETRSSNAIYHWKYIIWRVLSACVSVAFTCGISGDPQPIAFTQPKLDGGRWLRLYSNKPHSSHQIFHRCNWRPRRLAYQYLIQCSQVYKKAKLQWPSHLWGCQEENSASITLIWRNVSTKNAICSELSHGFFSDSNQKQLAGGGNQIPIFEAKMAGDLRLIYQIDCVAFIPASDVAPKVDKQRMSYY